MTDWDRVPVFGSRLDGPAAFRRTIRPSAYGIISDDDGRIAVVSVPSGVYLPGGGSDEGEAPESTVVRETREETGLEVRVGSWRGAAIDHTVSAVEETNFEKPSTFCDAVVVGAGRASEPDHVLEWVSAEEAIERLTPASHRWAVNEWWMETSA